jgi:hypothetical protein
MGLLCTKADMLYVKCSMTNLKIMKKIIGCADIHDPAGLCLDFSINKSTTGHKQIENVG